MVLESRTVVTIAAGHTIGALSLQHLTHKTTVDGAGFRLRHGDADAPCGLCRSGTGVHP